MSDKTAVRPPVVVLCGSTRFSPAFRAANLAETLEGRIVLTIGCDMRSDGHLFAGRADAEVAQIKTDLDELHKRKIDLADEVLVLNVGGYVGDSTRSEIAYAQNLGKTIRYLEDGTNGLVPAGEHEPVPEGDGTHEKPEPPQAWLDPANGCIWTEEGPASGRKFYLPGWPDAVPAEKMDKRDQLIPLLAAKSVVNLNSAISKVQDTVTVLDQLIARMAQEIADVRIVEAQAEMDDQIAQVRAAAKIQKQRDEDVMAEMRRSLRAQESNIEDARNQAVALAKRLLCDEEVFVTERPEPDTVSKIVWKAPFGLCAFLSSGSGEKTVPVEWLTPYWQKRAEQWEDQLGKLRQEQMNLVDHLLPEGSPVRYWTGAKEGPGKISTICTPVWALGSGTLVMAVKDNGLGGISLTHIEPLHLGGKSIGEVIASRLEELARENESGAYTSQDEGATETFREAAKLVRYWYKRT